MLHQANSDRCGRAAINAALTAMLLLSALLAGCGENTPPSAAIVSHPWINPPREVDDKAVVLPPFLIYRVDPKAMSEAIAELDREAYIQISPSMAEHYTGQAVTVPMEMRPFLVRALDTGNSEIKVVQSLQGLWTRTIGGEGSEPAKQPLVVLIDPTPVDIFVTVEAAAQPADQQ